METLSFLKFWRPIINENQTLDENNDTTTTTTTIEVEAAPSLAICSESELDEGDDSFFELELTVSDFDNKKNTHNNKESQQQTATATISSLSSTDVLSKRKILPIEPSSSSSSSLKPQSPISLLKSAPKLRVAIFKKPKSMAALKTEKTGEVEKTESSRKQNKLFTIKFKIEEAPNLSLFTRASSLRKTRRKESINIDSSTSSSSSSKRFSKDVIQKYLKLIKPLYVRVSKKKDKMGFPEGLTEASSSSPTASPAKKEKKGNIPSGFKHLGKSKSASAAAVMSPARRDDSLLLQHDGIQSAILHCKNSFNSRDSSSLSRSTSCSSQETFSNLFSRDSSLFSRFSSDSSSSEFLSARKSNEERI